MSGSRAAPSRCMQIVKLVKAKEEQRPDFHSVIVARLPHPGVRAIAHHMDGGLYNFKLVELNRS